FVYFALQTFLFINFTSPSYSIYVVVAYIYSILTFIAPLALTYAAVNGRLIDNGFVLNRTVVFAIVSAIVIGGFVIAEWATSEWFVSASHTGSVFVGMIVALALGISMRYIHKYVDRFVDTFFFRKRHSDEAALRNFAHEAAYVTDWSVLLERAADTVRRHTDTDGVTILLRSDSGTYTEYSDGLAAVSENDASIVALRAWGKPLHLHDVANSQLAGAVAFPMTARGVLVGVLMCGPKTSGESFAPDDVDALMALARGVAITLDSLNRESGSSIASLREAVIVLQARIATMQESVASELRGFGSSLRR
ncbi:MAG: GAF domain-containing protein, partial [Candidatus Baltobacteraceae bacterium]